MLPATDARTRRALLIGINQYPLLPASDQLNGCVNDVAAMADVLQKTLGFSSEQITILCDQQATRDGILAAIDALVDRTAPNDVVVVHYSGHGSQMTDREGDEAGGMDETLVPYDSGRAPHPNRDISDDELYARLLRLSAVTPYITLIFDCCHSGTITRDPFGPAGRSVEPDQRRADELPPVGLPADVIDSVRDGRRSVGPSGWLPLAQRYVLIAGCRDDEQSYEYTDKQGDGFEKYGALSYFLSQAIVNAPPGSTYRDVFEQVNLQVTARQMQQHPQLEGARDRELFGIRDIEPMRFVGVKSRLGSQVTLAAGAAHGLTVDSEWSIYAPATKQVTSETPQLGRVKLATVRATTSDATIVEEAQPNAIIAGARAVEAAHSYGEMRLVVEIQAAPGFDAAVQALRVKLAESLMIRIAQPSEPAEIRIYLLAPRAQAGTGDPVPQLGSLAQPTWVVVKDGQMMMPPHALDEPDVLPTLCENLEKAARYRQMLALRNDSVNNPLAGAVQLKLKRLAADGAWITAEPDDTSGQVIFAAGDQIGIETINNFTAPIYVSIFDFDVTGSVAMLYPFEGANEPIATGSSLQFGLREGETLTLALSEGARVPEQGEVEIIKVFVTTQPTDFGSLTQPGYRGLEVAGIDSPLGRLLATASTGDGTRTLVVRRVPNDKAWLTLERPFLLRNKPLYRKERKH